MADDVGVRMEQLQRRLAQQTIGGQGYSGSNRSTASSNYSNQQQQYPHQAPQYQPPPQYHQQNNYHQQQQYQQQQYQQQQYQQQQYQEQPQYQQQQAQYHQRQQYQQPPPQQYQQQSRQYQQPSPHRHEQQRQYAPQQSPPSHRDASPQHQYQRPQGQPRQASPQHVEQAQAAPQVGKYASRLGHHNSPKPSSTHSSPSTPLNDHHRAVKSSSSSVRESYRQAPSRQTRSNVPPSSPYQDEIDRQSYRFETERKLPSPIDAEPAFDRRSMPRRHRNEYDFQWAGGSLGLVLVEDPTNRVPVVKRLSTNASQASRVVQEGDLLLYINANPTRDYKMPALMGMLKDLPKPIIMRFKRSGADFGSEPAPPPAPVRAPAPPAPVATPVPAPVQTPAPSLASPPAVPSRPALLEGEYEFHWEDGSLGLAFSATAAELPYVKRLTGRGESPDLLLVTPGDELIMINDKVCAELGFDQSLQTIKGVAKPAILRFRNVKFTKEQAAPEPEPAAEPKALRLNDACMYSITWSDGPFGLTLKEQATDKGSVPIVTRKTGRNTCAGLQRVAIGDLLVEIGSMKVVDLGFENTTKVLRNVAKPVVLRFQAVTNK